MVLFFNHMVSSQIVDIFSGDIAMARIDLLPW